MNTLFSFRSLVLTSFLIFLTSATEAQCVSPDYDGLEKFYLATNGDDWTDNSGWLTDCEPCAWKGVGCDENQRVVSLVLRGNGLTGKLPEDFAALPLLKLINIGYNEVAGELPASLFELDALEDIYLTGNRLTGNFPATFGSRPQLTKLRIANNQLSGELPAELVDFPGMSLLALDGNNFTGSVPPGFGDLTSVFAIDLSNNDLSGCFPDDLALLCGNTRIRFGGNRRMSWKGDFTQFCSGRATSESQQGAPCDDGNAATSNTVITENCLCGVSSNTEGPARAETEISGYGETDETEMDPFLRTGNGPGIIAGAAPTVTNLTAFPNPLVGSTLNVRLPAAMVGAEVRLLSLTGREITRAANVTTGFSLNVPVLEAGVYLLEAVSGAKRKVTRVIVQ